MKDEASATSPEEMHIKAQALAWNLFGLSAFFWIVCAGFWIGMAYTIDGTSTAKGLQLAIHRKDSNGVPRKTDDEVPLL